MELSNEELGLISTFCMKADPMQLVPQIQALFAKVQQEARSRQQEHEVSTPQENGKEPETATAGWNP